MSVVIVFNGIRYQVCSTWKIQDSRCVGRTRAIARYTSVAVCDGSVDSRGIVRDAIANCTVRLDIPKDCIVVWVWIEASNALVFDIFHPIRSTIEFRDKMLARLHMWMGEGLRASGDVGRFVSIASIERECACRVQAEYNGRWIDHFQTLKQQVKE